MARWWQYLVPKYGNFGGPGWSGGAMMDNYDEVDWFVRPTDSLDQCFHDHDRRYQFAIQEEDDGIIDEVDKLCKWIGADGVLISEMNNLSSDPKEWKIPPTAHSNAYAWFYRKAAIIIFEAKIILSHLIM